VSRLSKKDFTVSSVLDKKPGVRDRFHNSGRHDAPDEVCGIADMPPVGAGSDDDVTSALPGASSIHAASVTLPFA
jgi:hypothetical protein